MTPAERLRNMRKARNYTQQELAIEIGASASRISAAETTGEGAERLIQRLRETEDNTRVRGPRSTRPGVDNTVRRSVRYWLEDGKLMSDEDSGGWTVKRHG